jgi:predicted nucleic acid-binding protein
VIVVANAGPLIALARIDHLSLLPDLYGQVSIPPAVQREITNFGPQRPGAAEIKKVSWVKVVEIQDTIALRLLRERLDLGESEAIVLALEMEADLLLIDEARGRRVAEARGLNKTGTIGTLILAKKRGLIPAITPLLDNLIASGFHMSPNLYQTAQSLANESWPKPMTND